MKNRDFGYSSIFLSSHARVFLAVAEKCNLTDVAKLLGMSQSTVSYHVAELEKQLKIPLLDRFKRPLQLTAEGRLIADELSYLYNQLSESVRKAESRSNIRPVIRLGIIESLSMNLGTHLIKKLAASSTEISMISGTSERLVSAMEDHQLDVILASTPFVDEQKFAQKLIYVEPSVLCLPRNHGFSFRKYSWEELKFCGLPFLRYNRSSGGHLITELFLNSHFLYFPNRVEVDDGGMMLSLIESGLGWSLIRPATLIQHPEIARKIMGCPMPDPVLEREVSLIFRKNDATKLSQLLLEEARGFYMDELEGKFLEVAPWLKESLKKNALLA